MRNPGESSEGRVQSETSSEAYAKGSERDECDSPPCKRLKQGVLSFPTVSSSPLTSMGSIKTPVSVQSNAVSISNCQNKLSEPCETKTQPGGGLVTGAPSPPDLKESLGKPQNTTDLSKISKSLVLENTDDKPVVQIDASSISSPESNSSSREDEAMVIDQSPPVKGNRRHLTPKSVEKLKRKEEQEKERQEKQRLREEKLKEKQEAKAAKEKERLEAKRKRDLEKQEKQAERERREKERIERREKEERERLEKKGKREEERRKREEENNAKIEEKRKREEERRNQEEEKTRKRLKREETFVGYFTKTSAPKVPN
ncbi:vicilin-like seed storage protein At2g18540 [Stylophora pistillata]|uniref:vicilin-like seed storage protein At2g18540 n=1 Tax=Stylophora pistillata TaxID=50429 RepID=UPI000C03929C|nr:vicilin-like seed storage protein At2g18540 [Stylophora pistillata]